MWLNLKLNTDLLIFQKQFSQVDNTVIASAPEPTIQEPVACQPNSLQEDANASGDSAHHHNNIGSATTHEEQKTFVSTTTFTLSTS